ncbi:MAG: hypothetical protein MZV63_04655 [Marinilabiliales bacterium]|nr:hypothetical protein [Marinilabiliales bacterium]
MPEATAAYISEWFEGFTAKSDILPEAHAGPIERKEILLNSEERNGGLDLLLSLFCLFLCIFLLRLQAAGTGK